MNGYRRMKLTLIGAIACGASLLALASCEDSGDNGERAPTGGGSDNSPALRSAQLATVELADGRPIVLRASGKRDVGDRSSCLSIHGIDKNVRACGLVPSERDPSRGDEPVLAESMAQTKPSAPLEIYGATSSDVTKVRVTFTVGGSARAMPAALMRASDEGKLDKVEIREPFGYFLAELPSMASRVRAIAFDAHGARLGSAGYGFLHDLPPRAFIATDR